MRTLSPILLFLIAATLFAGGIVIGVNVQIGQRGAALPAGPNAQQVQSMDAMSHHHPALDCSAYTGSVQATDDTVAIASLGTTHEAKTVRVRAHIIAVFHDILGTNWYQLCDRNEGEMLMAETRQRVTKGQDVIIEGTLRLQYTVPHVYTFPKFLEKAHIDGHPKAAPVGVTFL
ncbi:MAG: hypothetical protein VX589_00945 [Myxococcota bacterium]|nr:hypothetical protein [Myxococcota bacterium]